MSKNNFREYICRPYCIFFKDGEKEEMACRGAEVVERLVERNRITSAGIASLKNKPALWNSYKEKLGKYVCRQCSFRAGDCDFQTEEPPDDAAPCGGFILLALLWGNNLINNSDMEEQGEG